MRKEAVRFNILVVRILKARALIRGGTGEITVLAIPRGEGAGTEVLSIRGGPV